MLSGYSLQDDILLDSLLSVGSSVKEYALVGGTAAALYVYPKCGDSKLRKTTDLDISLLHKLSESCFMNGIGADVCESLQSLDYSPSLKKVRTHYEVLVGGDGRGPFFVHFSNRPNTAQQYFARRIEKEIENAADVKIPRRESSIKVVRPEDIVLSKLQMRRPKDLLDIGLIKRYGPTLDMDYLHKNAEFWFGGEEKIIDSVIDYLKGL